MSEMSLLSARPREKAISDVGRPCPVALPRHAASPRAPMIARPTTTDPTEVRNVRRRLQPRRSSQRWAEPNVAQTKRKLPESRSRSRELVRPAAPGRLQRLQRLMELEKSSTRSRRLTHSRDLRHRPLKTRKRCAGPCIRHSLTLDSTRHTDALRSAQCLARQLSHQDAYVSRWLSVRRNAAMYAMRSPATRLVGPAHLADDQ
jgi:hypothetical protein